MYVCMCNCVCVCADRQRRSHESSHPRFHSGEPTLPHDIFSHISPRLHLGGMDSKENTIPLFFLSPGASLVPLDFLGVHRSLPNKRKSNGTKLASHSYYLPNPRPLYSAIIPCDNNDEILHNHAREGSRSYWWQWWWLIMQKIIKGWSWGQEDLAPLGERWPSALVWPLLYPRMTGIQADRYIFTHILLPANIYVCINTYML